MTRKRGTGQTIIPNKYCVDSFERVGARSRMLYLNCTRKFVPIGTPYKRYFAPMEDSDEDKKSSSSKVIDGPSEKSKLSDEKTDAQNKWGTKFRDVDKIMAWLCYEQKIYKKKDGKPKNYTVCYEDRFLGIVETEVWRFHQEMDVPSHRVR